MGDKYYELAKELGIIDEDEKCSYYGECSNQLEYPEKDMKISRLKENILLLVEELQIKQEIIKNFQDELENARNRINYLENDNRDYWDRIQMLQKIIDELELRKNKDDK